MKRGPDIKKVERIMKTLKYRSPEGIWIRELARQTRMPVSTISLYINKFLKDRIEVEAAKIGNLTHSQIKVVKLKVKR